MRIETHADLTTEAKRIAQAAGAAGVEQKDFGGEVQGWVLIEGTATEHKQGTEWGGLCTADGIIILTADGEIDQVWGVYGDSEELGSMNHWGTKPPTRARLFGDPREPFAAVTAGLRKLEGLASTS